jgi:hypothetical protein
MSVLTVLAGLEVFCTLGTTPVEEEEEEEEEE